MIKNRFLTYFFFWIFGAASLKAADPKVCLTLVVKNDAEVIWHCLNSVKDVVDCVCICDVGSTDKTLEIVNEFIKSSGIPGTVYQQYWVNTAFNHLLSVQTSQKMLKNLGYSLLDSYLLVMEPDMALQTSPAFQKSDLKAHSYLISEKSKLGFASYNLHLFRASARQEYDSLLQDHWSSKDFDSSTKLHSLLIEDIASEKRTRAKSAEIITILEEALGQDPDNVKYIFHLAHLYRYLKQYEKAIELYRLHIKKKWENNQWESEEVWLAKYMIGECYEGMDSWDQALYWYLDAYQQDPNRADSLKKVATHYRLHGQNDLAYIFAKYGSLIPRLNNSMLLTTLPLEYQFDEELSITAYYTRFKEDGYEGCNNLILKKNIPDHVRNQAYQNIIFYVNALPNTRFRAIDVNLPLIQEGSDEYYHPMNPSIQKTPSGYKVICRTVNYTQVGAKIFNTIDKNGIFRTRNFLIEYDRDFRKLSQCEILEDLDRERIPFISIEGLDDCRIFDFNGSSWFTCTTNDTNPAGNFQISLCELPDVAKGDTIHVKTLVPLKGPDPYRCEKNWLPFIKEGSLHAIYSYDPFVIYKPDIETGDCEVVVHYNPSYDFSHFRGSAGPLAWEDGFLVMVHEVVQNPDYSRYYLHRFLYLDKNFTVVLASKPFTFRHLGIEYCCSMVIDPSSKELIMALGIEDSEAYLCSIDLADIKAFLKPLHPLNQTP